MSTYETIKVEQTSSYVQRVTLDRPQCMNALNTQMMTDVRDHFGSLYVDQSGIRCIVLTGREDKAFCSGGDLKERNGMSDQTWRQQHAVLEQMVRALMHCPVPIIAAVNGACFGGGLEIALTADFIYASDTATFGFPEGRLGIMPGACGTQNLVRACGQRRAKEISLTGTPFSAKNALDWHVVNKVVPHQELLTATDEAALAISLTAPMSGQQIKKSLNIAVQSDLSTGYAFELAAYNLTVPTKDRLEGVAAFNEKRKPQFRGE